jgi:phosphate transport system permease protein
MQREIGMRDATLSPDTQVTGTTAVDLSRRTRWGERVIQTLLLLCAVLSIFVTVGIVYELARESLNFFTRRLWEDTNKRIVAEIDESTGTLSVSEGGFTLREGDIVRLDGEAMEIVSLSSGELTVARGQQGTTPVAHDAGTTLFKSSRVTLGEFFTSTKWNPQIGNFGILPLVTSTLITSSLAMTVALPLGLSAAIYLSEYASERTRKTLKPILEVLAGIPTVVYGYFALTFMTPLLRSILGRDVVEVYNMAAGGIVMGILILPMVISMSEDALSAVPNALRQAAYGMGATKLETATQVVVPAAFSGIAAAFIVSISRAIGETMIMAIAVGAGPAFTFNPFQSAETMTGHIARISSGDISYDSIDYNSIFAIGLVLFFMTLTLNIISQRIVRRYREVYQ